MSKESRKAELQKQYEEELQKIEDETEEDDEYEGDVIILRGKARDRFLDKMERAGFSEEQAEEIADEVEEEVEESETESETDDEKDKEKAAPKKEKEKTVEDKNQEKDPEPPPRHRYFGKGK